MFGFTSLLWDSQALWSRRSGFLFTLHSASSSVRCNLAHFPQYGGKLMTRPRDFLFLQGLCRPQVSMLPHATPRCQKAQTLASLHLCDLRHFTISLLIHQCLHNSQFFFCQLFLKVIINILKYYMNISLPVVNQQREK